MATRMVPRANPTKRSRKKPASRKPTLRKHVKEHKNTRKAITTKTSKHKLHPENCPRPLASALLADRKAALKSGKKPPYRYGNCATPSASYALAHGSKGSKFSGKVTKRKAGVKRKKTHKGLKNVKSRMMKGSWVDSWW